MSSSTESMSKGEEKKGNSENNPNDQTRKETSILESNSNGARPMTSSTLQKPEKQIEEEKQPLKVLIMNTGTYGTNEGKGKSATNEDKGEGKSATNEDKSEGKSATNENKGNANRRKQTIQNVIDKHKPDLVLFQEFRWENISGSIWKNYPLKEHYELTTGGDARIMYNKDKLTVEEMQIMELESILDTVKRSTSKDETPIPLDFNPIPRMSLRLVETMSVPIMKFICISWHGEYKDDEKLPNFKNLMTFVNQIHVMKELPLLIAGDFNLNMKIIDREVKGNFKNFKLHEYEASERRKKKEVIDCFIATTELDLPVITSVDLKKDSQAMDPEEVLDHDPVTAILKPAPTPETDLPLDEVTDTNGQRDELPAIGGLNISDVTPEDQKKDSKADKPKDVLRHDTLTEEIEAAP